MSQSLEDVKKIIKSLVLAQQNGLSPLSLNSEFIDVEGRPIPWKSFGSNTLTEFLRTLSDIIMPGFNKAGEQVFFPKVDSSTAHIAKFVAQQKPQPVKRRNNMVRHDDKRPCRELNSVHMLPRPSSPSPPPHPQPHSPERTGSRRSGNSNGTSDRRREPEKSERFERRRAPSPMSISPPPRHSPTPEPDRFRNPSPPRHGRPHSSFRDPSPNRSRRLLHDVSLSNQPSTSNDYDKELARARERRGLNSQSSRSRRSRSPSPRRHRHRPSPPPPSPPKSRRSPPRIQSKSVSCQTESDKVIAKKLVSVCCQTENQTTEKPRSVKAQPAQPTQPDPSVEPEDLNLAYYGPNYGVNYNNINNPYSSTYNPVHDPSYEEDKSQPGFYYDFDAGTHKPIPIIPEYYAAWIWAGWVPGTGSQQQQQQQQQQNPFPHHQAYPNTPYQAPTIPSTPMNAYVNSTPPEAPPQPMKVIPTTPSAKSVTRDPRLARQTATLANNNANKTNVNNHDKQSTVANAATAKRKALSINDYMKTRKLGPDKSQHIINEEAQETPEKMNNSPDHYGKWGTKRG